MKFFELLQKVEFGPVWGYLQAHYDLEDKLLMGYRNAFDDLRAAKPAKLEKEMLLVVAKGT